LRDETKRKKKSGDRQNERHGTASLDCRLLLSRH